MDPLDWKMITLTWKLTGSAYRKMGYDDIKQEYTPVKLIFEADEIRADITQMAIKFRITRDDVVGQQLFELKYTLVDMLVIEATASLAYFDNDWSEDKPDKIVKYHEDSLVMKQAVSLASLIYKYAKGMEDEYRQKRLFAVLNDFCGVIRIR